MASLLGWGCYVGWKTSGGLVTFAASCRLRQKLDLNFRCCHGFVFAVFMMPCNLIVYDVLYVARVYIGVASVRADYSISGYFRSCHYTFVLFRTAVPANSIPGS